MKTDSLNNTVNSFYFTFETLFKYNKYSNYITILIIHPVN